VAQAALAVYSAALAAATIEAASQERAGNGDDGYLLVPVVLTTMHLAHGLGFLEGCVRWGAPWRALWRVAGGRGEPGPYRGPVDAPSLSGDGQL
jgi:hypothetical protein